MNPAEALPHYLDALGAHGAHQRTGRKWSLDLHLLGQLP